MGRIGGTIATLYVCALLGLPLDQLAIGGGILLMLLGFLASMVSATEYAKKLFGYAIPALVFGLTWHIAVAFAQATAALVIGTVVFLVVAYVVGSRALNALTEDNPVRPAERPRPRLRADPPPRFEPPSVPRPDNTPLDLFSRGRRRPR